MSLVLVVVLAINKPSIDLGGAFEIIILSGVFRCEKGRDPFEGILVLCTFGFV